MSTSFLSHGKQKVKIKDACKKGSHDWSVSKWLIKSGHKSASEFYCRYCLLTLDSAEKDYQSRQSCSAQADREAQAQET